MPFKDVKKSNKKNMPVECLVFTHISSCGFEFPSGQLAFGWKDFFQEFPAGRPAADTFPQSLFSWTWFYFSFIFDG